MREHSSEPVGETLPGGNRLRKPVVLTGFMAAGKSRVGRWLASSLKLDFVDLDEEISASFAAPIPVVIANAGEATFRKREALLLRQALSRGGRVVATGGGAILDPANRELMAGAAHWVNLDISLQTARRRLAADGAEERPLWSDEAAGELFEGRAPLYAVAPHHVDAEAAPEAVAKAIGASLPAAVTAPAQPSFGPLQLQVEVPGASYPVIVGRQTIEGLPAAMAGVGSGPVALLTDWNVGLLYGDRVEGVLRAAGRDVIRHTFAAGESAKDVGAVLQALDALLDRAWPRDGVVVALGGGVVGDMAGLVAALALRGVALVQVPTTLLAMVDSSVGGKVGVNHRSGKNRIGAFHQPKLVYVDLAFLDTLPDRELRAGLAEAVKSAALGDRVLLERIEEGADRALSREPALLAEIVLSCCRFKAAVVAQDERESGLRKILNFGHNLGHAVEAAAGYGVLRHGEAVAIGMVAASALGARFGVGDVALGRRIEAALVGLGLPTMVPPLARDALVQAMNSDKKVASGRLTWVFLKEIGAAVLRELPLSEVDSWLACWEQAGLLQVLDGETP